MSDKPDSGSPASEPVAWMDAHDHTNLYYRKPTQVDVVPLYAHPPAALPEQEPVAPPVGWRDAVRRLRQGVAAGSWGTSDIDAQQSIAFPLFDAVEDALDEIETNPPAALPEPGSVAKCPYCNPQRLSCVYCGREKRPALPEGWLQETMQLVEGYVSASVRAETSDGGNGGRYDRAVTAALDLLRAHLKRAVP